MIGIVVPTLNRSEFVIRLINYYSNLNTSHTLYIGDSSDSFHAQQILHAIEKVSNKIKIVYKAYPGLNTRATQKELIGITKEKFCVYCADDDWLIPDSLNKCAEFLVHNPDYRIARGKAIGLNLTKPDVNWEIRSIWPYWAGKNKNDDIEDSIERFKSFFLGHYWVSEYAVHRTQEFYEDHENTEKYIIQNNDNAIGEIMTGLLTILRGKSKFIDCLYLVRGIHESRYVGLDTFDCITSPNWYTNYQVIKNTIVNALVQEGELDKSKAADMFKERYIELISFGMQKLIQKVRRDGTPTKVGHIRKYIKTMIGGDTTVKAIRKICAKIPSQQKKLSLYPLLSSSSPYHNDFMPVYNSINSKLFT